MSTVEVEEYIREWLTALVTIDGLLITISLMVLTIVFTTPAFQLWGSVLVGSVVLIASIHLMYSAFNAMDAHGTLILMLKTFDEKRKEELNQKMRRCARKAEISFKIALALLIVSIVIVILLPPVTTLLINQPQPK